MKEQLEKLKGRLIKVIHNDGDNIQVVKGRLISVSDDCLCLETRCKVLIIAIPCVQKIKAALNDGGGVHGF